MLRIRQRLERLEDAILPPESSQTLVLRIQAVDEDGDREEALVLKVPLPPPPRSRWRGTEDSSRHGAGIQREAETENAAGREPSGAI